MSDRNSYIVMILLGIPFLVLGGFLLSMEISVVLRKYEPSTVVTLAEDPFDYWFGIFIAFLPGVWLTFAGVHGLLKGKRKD